MSAKNGDTVLVHYTGTLSDGTEFDSSRGRAPLEAALGESMLIPGFENALFGMKPGETKDVTIPPDQAYGERIEDLVITLPRDDVSSRNAPEPGMLVALTMDNGEELEAVITDVTDDSIVLDANHPLAGESLSFSLELVEIKK